MAELKLYNYFRSSTSYRVRIALHSKNLPFVYEPIHLLKDGGEQHSPAFRAINPMGEVPTLVHGSEVLSQSLPIMEYIDEVFPQNSYLPKDPATKAKVRQVCEHINSFMHPISNLKVLQFLETKHGYDLAAKEGWIQHWSAKGFQALETLAQQSSGLYFFGDSVTMADFVLIPQMFSAQRFNVNLEKYPHLNKVNSNCLKLEAFQKAHPYRQVDTPAELKIS